MRNKILLQLTEAHQQASAALTDYLRHLDARETDASYVHARMLFEEGWRYFHDPKAAVEMDKAQGGERSYGNTTVHCLWMASDGESHARKDAGEIEPILQALQLSSNESSVTILTFLAELTSEVGDSPPGGILE